ncbi:MAG TPA: hypothetical protein VIA45_05865 [Thermoanaerobaculia bacterium]
MSRFVRLALLLWVAPLASRLLAQAPPFGGEFQVNTYTTGDQDAPSVAVAPDGQFMIAWQSRNPDSTHSVFAQLYDAGGSKNGAEIAVNTFTTGTHANPQVAAASDGNFVVTWEEDNGIHDGSYYGVIARKFQHGGNDGPDFLVPTYSANGQYFPAVAMGADSSFVVVWAGNYAPDHAGILGQRFGPDLGPAVGSEFRVNSGTSEANFPSVAVDGSGNFVVVWEDYRDLNGIGISGQRFDASGAKVGSAFLINTHTTGDQRSPKVAMGRHGDFVVVWLDESGEDGDGAGVFGQRFDASGEKVGTEFQVNTYTSEGQAGASVAMDSRGGFVVTWIDGYLNDSPGAVAGQRFDRTGAKVGSEFAVNTSTTGAVYGYTSVSSGGGDGFVVTWAHAGTDGSGIGVVRQRTNPLPRPMRVDAHSSSGTTSDLNGVLEPGETVRVETAWQNVGSNAFSRAGTASAFMGPGGALYHINNTTADYGSIPKGATVNCYDASAAHDCYRVTVDAPASRPATHWDATFQEDLDANGSQIWTLHVGESFSDVPRSEPFYAKIETMLHFGITTGCTPTAYCPGDVVPRDQMAIFIAKAIAGTGPLVPTAGRVGAQSYDCINGGHSLFTDVSPADPACKHVHYLAQQNVTLGCNTGLYCPTDSITRDAMASFVAKAIFAPKGGAAVPLTYGPDPKTGFSYSCDSGSPNTHFTDVPASQPFCKHIHYLWATGVLGGCTPTTYCPSGTVTRDAMAKFIANGFGLTLYGP